MNKHTPQKLLEISRQYARQSKWAKRRGRGERAQELMALSRFCWEKATPDLNSSLKPERG